MKIQIEIPEEKLYFLNVLNEYKNFTIVNYGYAGTWLMENDSKELNHWKVSLPNGNYEVLGFVNDVIVGEIETDKNFVLRII
jgi:hypothetical protein